MKKNVLILSALMGILVFVMLPKISMAATSCASIGYTATYSKSGNFVNLSTPITHLNGSSNGLTLNGIAEGAWSASTSQYTYTMWENGSLYQKTSTGQNNLICTVPTSTFVVQSGTTGTKSTGGSVTTPINQITNASGTNTGGSTGSSGSSSSAGSGPTGLSSWMTVFGTRCDTYKCWINKVWIYATGIVVPLSTLMLIYAGILWNTSGGDPEKIGKAKKIITGVVSGILLLVFARVFIVNVIGLDSGVWNVQ